ncbi:CAMK family protein kinase [Tritrichomonas foetus]|uniref:CAMK family protein kinase n=1 Tax=Tritrichomonas foetus TaxID=1144522 RepID=A0A1J4KJX7_9EUKA|nr:CAMK family protein kinase [Tritrichomonas foetus]|eukprot:OHT09990.1 CAMK family protein kinase [Tritrichomonas foetus]
MFSEKNDSGYEYIIPSTVKCYKVISKISSGSFSVVFKVLNMKTNEYYAMKVVSREQMIKYSSIFQLEQELRILETTNHPNIIKLHEIVYEKTYIYIIMELSDTDLLTALMIRGSLLQCEIRHIFQQICHAIKYLHSKGISHHDLKPENILLDKDDVCKIADFGSAFTKKPPHDVFGATLNYVAPEAILNDTFDYKKADIWTLGIILYILTTSSFPFQLEGSDVEIAHRIINADYQIPFYVDKESKQIIAACLQKKPEDRPTIDELIDIMNKGSQVKFISAQKSLKPKKIISSIVSTSVLTSRMTKNIEIKNKPKIRVSNSVNLSFL